MDGLPEGMEGELSVMCTHHWRSSSVPNVVLGVFAVQSTVVSCLKGVSGRVFGLYIPESTSKGLGIIGDIS